MATSKNLQEDAVRTYLRAVEDPDSLRDQDAINKAQDAVDSASDPLDRLRAHAALRKMQATDEQWDSITQSFTEHAKAWADSNGLTGEDFLALGVSADVLRKAGFKVSVSSGGRSSSKGRKRAPSVPEEDIRAAINGLSKTFTIKDVTETTGTNAARVKSLLDAEAAQDPQTIEVVGPDPDHSGRGRAPTLYKRLKKL